MRISTEPNAKQRTRPTPRTGGHMTKWTRLLAITSVLALALAACSSDSSSGKSSSDTKASTTTTKAKAAAKPAATADPTTGLTNGSSVTVKVSGFTAKTVGINECAQAGDAEVGQDDCDLSNIAPVTIAADGTGEGTITVSTGPIGKAAHMCTTAGTRCFLSTGELSADPNAERADDIDLTFTG